MEGGGCIYLAYLYQSISLDHQHSQQLSERAKLAKPETWQQVEQLAELGGRRGEGRRDGEGGQGRKGGNWLKLMNNAKDN